MPTRRRLVQAAVAGSAGFGLVPSWLRTDVAEAATTDSNAPGFDLAGTNARYLGQGAPFSPFLMKFAKVSDLGNLWDSQRGNTQVSFWKVRGHVSGNKRFLPLGDMVSVNGGGPQSVAAMLLAPDNDNPDVLRNPVRFEWRTDDHGSGNPRDIAYFQPIPPDGYTALGVCFNVSNADVSNYWCVRNDQLRVLRERTTAWNDSGSKFSHNGDLLRGVLGPADVAPPGVMFILPTALIGIETSIPAAALITKKLSVDSVKWLAPGAPPFDPTVTQGDKSSPGIQRVMVLPCTAVADPTQGNQASVSPFYYVVSRPVWVCTSTDSVPEGGNNTYTLTVGTSDYSSSEFRRATSWNVSASTGFTAGGASASVSVSFTQEFALTTAQSTTNSTSVTETRNVLLPRANVVQFWQLFSRISMYRGSGALVSSVEYGKKDYRVLTKEG
jgi:hypothetical protein